MAGLITNDQRDMVITAFRHRLCETMGVTPFAHQAAWWAAADGLVLVPTPDPEGIEVSVPLDVTNPAAGVRSERWGYLPRDGGRARTLALLGSFKIGKSWSAGMWLAAFAAVPGAKVVLVGMEYDITAPEFEYILDALLSERGMNQKAVSVQNRPRDGKMWLDLPNGAHFETRSWERRDSLKGKEVDVYCFCEAYQFPGIECYTSIAQNLRARQGYALFPTTPDRPWVKELRDKALSGDPAFDDWFCESDVDASQNPFTYDVKARERDRQIMTREKFVIHYEGKVGDFVGSVYGFQKGQRQFTPQSHPQLYKPGTKVASRDSLVVPDGWQVMAGADTGTFYTAAWVMFSPEGDAFVLDELPNYRYVGGRPERYDEITIPQWSRTFVHTANRFRTAAVAQADMNSQFKQELLKHGVTLLGNKVLFEARTEIAREYFQHNKIFLAPWLQILPFELEGAEWPEDTNSAGRFARLKQHDHTLDCVEHVLSKRPRGKSIVNHRAGSWLYAQLGGPPKRTAINPHLGSR